MKETGEHRESDKETKPPQTWKPGPQAWETQPGQRLQQGKAVQTDNEQTPGLLPQRGPYFS